MNYPGEPGRKEKFNHLLTRLNYMCKMNVYDFDGTIYSGDSTKDFIVYEYRKYPWLIKYLPRQIIGCLMYKMGLISKIKMKENVYQFFKDIDINHQELDEFAKAVKHKVKVWYLQQKSDDDVIISASPEFIVRSIMEQINDVKVIASEVNPITGIYSGENCKGEEKVRRFRKYFPQQDINAFYSDTLDDLPMAQISRKAYRVKKNDVVFWMKSK